MDTVFKENSFSKKSLDLYNQVIADRQTALQLAVFREYDLATESHSRGVGHVAAEYAISGITDLDSDELLKFIRLAIFHDVGKLSIAQYLLNKPGKLSRNEWKVIEHHSVDGFHRYAAKFDPDEAIPTLLHHTLQPNNYPHALEIERNIAIYGIDPVELSNDKVLTETIMLALSDNIEARYPYVDGKQEQKHLRTYSSRRDYIIDDLPDLVRASFIESGKVRAIGKIALLDKLIDYSRETFLRK